MSDSPPQDAPPTPAGALPRGSPDNATHPHHRYRHLHGHHQLSSVLRTLADHDERAIPVGAMIAALGARAHGMALLILVLPEAIPLPIPSAGAVLGIPLMIVAAHLLVFGEHSGFPERVKRVAMPVFALRAVVRYLAPVLDFLEGLSRPRWPAVARSERVAGGFCLYLAVLLFMPIPFVNFPMALCLAAIALGMVMRDGLFVAAGFAGTLTLTGVFAVLIATLRAQLLG